MLAAGAQITIALWRARGRSLHYRLCLLRDGTRLVCYHGTAPGGARRQLRGRTLPYEFRSVEQLRYDFERDLEAANGAHD